MVKAIELDGVSKYYSNMFGRPARALADVSLSVGDGESFGFVGPNGAGKSTTMKILMGIVTASVGTAKIYGLPVETAEARKGIGFVPENPYLYDYLTPYEVLAMGCHLHDVRVDNLQSHIMTWLERFGVAHVAKKRIRKFSKGMTQRVALAHALAIKPRMLVLDEPMSGLDPVGRREVADQLVEYRQDGGTLFFSSHILHDVERLADRIGIVHKGVLRTVQSPAELIGDCTGYWIRVEGYDLFQGGMEESTGRWKIRSAAAELPVVLERINASGQRLLAVEPEATLEAAFMRYVSQQG